LKWKREKIDWKCSINTTIGISQTFKNEYKIKECTIKIDRHNLFPHQMREISLIDFTSIPMNINNNDTSRKRECVISSNIWIDRFSLLFWKNLNRLNWRTECIDETPTWAEASSIMFWQRSMITRAWSWVRDRDTIKYTVME
jgi:hypothetical protein